MMHGEGVTITPDMVPDVSRQPKVMDAAAEAGRELARRLQDGHDRAAVTRAMQEKMMAVFASSA